MYTECANDTIVCANGTLVHANDAIVLIIILLTITIVPKHSSYKLLM